MHFEALKCPNCGAEFNLNDRKPHNMPDCGHTFCTPCLDRILAESAQCPLDHVDITPRRNTVDDFKISEAMTKLIEENKQLQLCPDHEERLKLACLTHQAKICSECVLFGKHRGCEVKPLKDYMEGLEDQKRDLNDAINRWDDCHDNVMDLLRDNENIVAKTVQDTFGELKDIVDRREGEMLDSISNFFVDQKSQVSRKFKDEGSLRSTMQDKLFRMDAATRNEHAVDMGADVTVLAMNEGMDTQALNADVAAFADQLKKLSGEFKASLAGRIDLIAQSKYLLKDKWDMTELESGKTSGLGRRQSTNPGGESSGISRASTIQSPGAARKSYARTSVMTGSPGGARQSMISPNRQSVVGNGGARQSMISPNRQSVRQSVLSPEGGARPSVMASGGARPSMMNNEGGAARQSVISPNRQSVRQGVLSPEGGAARPSMMASGEARQSVMASGSARQSMISPNRQSVMNNEGGAGRASMMNPSPNRQSVMTSGGARQSMMNASPNRQSVRQSVISPNRQSVRQSVLSPEGGVRASVLSPGGNRMSMLNSSPARPSMMGGSPGSNARARASAIMNDGQEALQSRVSVMSRSGKKSIVNTVTDDGIILNKNGYGKEGNTGYGPSARRATNTRVSARINDAPAMYRASQYQSDSLDINVGNEAARRPSAANLAQMERDIADGKRGSLSLENNGVVENRNRKSVLRPDAVKGSGSRVVFEDEAPVPRPSRVIMETGNAVNVDRRGTKMPNPRQVAELIAQDEEDARNNGDQYSEEYVQPDRRPSQYDRRASEYSIYRTEDLGDENNSEPRSEQMERRQSTHTPQSRRSVKSNRSELCGECGRPYDEICELCGTMLSQSPKRRQHHHDHHEHDRSSSRDFSKGARESKRIKDEEYYRRQEEERRAREAAEEEEERRRREEEAAAAAAANQGSSQQDDEDEVCSVCGTDLKDSPLRRAHANAHSEPTASESENRRSSMRPNNKYGDEAIRPAPVAEDRRRPSERTPEPRRMSERRPSEERRPSQMRRTPERRPSERTPERRQSELRRSSQYQRELTESERRREDERRISHRPSGRNVDLGVSENYRPSMAEARASRIDYQPPAEARRTTRTPSRQDTGERDGYNRSGSRGRPSQIEKTPERRRSSCRRKSRPGYLNDVDPDDACPSCGSALSLSPKGKHLSRLSSPDKDSGKKGVAWGDGAQENSDDAYLKLLSPDRSSPGSSPGQVKANTIFVFEQQDNYLKIIAGAKEPEECLLLPKKWKDLTRVYIKWETYDIAEEDMEALASVWRRLEKVESFKMTFAAENLPYGFLEAVLPKFMWRAKQLKTVKFDLENSNPKDEALLYLASSVIPKITDVKELSILLWKSDVTDQAVSTLLRSLGNLLKSLESLTLGLRTSPIGDNAIHTLFVEMPKLKSLNLDFTETNITDKGLLKLLDTTLPSTKMLNQFKLCLWGTQISDKTIVPLFLDLGYVRKFLLDIGSTNITEKAIKALADFGQDTNNAMRDFELHMDNVPCVNDKSVSALFTTMRNVKRFVLNLDSTGVSDSCVQTFTNNTLSSLELLEVFKISLSNTKVTDKAAQLIMSNLHNVTKFTLGLESTQVSDNFVREFVDNVAKDMIFLRKFKMFLNDTRVSRSMIKKLEELDDIYRGKAKYVKGLTKRSSIRRVYDMEKDQ